MRRLEYFDQARMRNFAQGILRGTTVTNFARMIGVEHGRSLVAVVVFDRFTENDCEISIASDGSKNWLAPQIMRRIAAYPFVQLKLDRVTAFVDNDNPKARKFVCRLGFVHEGMKRHADSHKQVMMFGLLRSECVWVSALPTLSNAA